MSRFFLIIFSVFLLSSCGSIQLYQGPDSQKKAKSSTKSTSVNEKCLSPYTVKKGETLSGIAQKCALSQSMLIKVNQLIPPYWLKINQTLILIPTAESFEIPTNNFIWPVKNIQEYQFKKDKSQEVALVIKANKGTAVYAVEAGKVSYSGRAIDYFGNLVIIKHDNGYLTLYAHLAEIVIKEGQRIKQGQKIATVGKTGNVTSPQLYLEVRYRGKKVDAKDYFTLIQI